MNRWLVIEIKTLLEYQTFTRTFNQVVAFSSDKVYYQLLTVKKKNEKYKIFYIADEGSNVVSELESLFNFSICKIPPDRKLLTRVGGWSRNKEWMRDGRGSQ